MKKEYVLGYGAHPLIQQIEEITSDDLETYADEVNKIAFYYVNQLIDIACDSYGLGFSNEAKNKAKREAINLAKTIMGEMK